MEDFGDLNTPAWVRAAWSQPPKKGEILLRSVGTEGNWETNAVVRKADGYAYSEGYRLAGRIVADHAIQNTLDSDFLVYPIAFLYRHYVELQLKRLIPTGASLVNQTLTESNLKQLQTSHRLDQLWSLFEPILQEAAKEGFNIPSEDIEGMDSYLRQLHEIDEGSFSFRYAVTKLGKPSIDKDKLPHINIGVLAEGMEKLTSYLFGLGEVFREAYQSKCEMEAEARAEYIEYHDGE